MADDQTTGSVGGGGGRRITRDRRELHRTILELEAFGVSIATLAQRLLDTTGDGRGAEYLTIADQLEKFREAARMIIPDLRARAVTTKEPAP